MELKQHPEPSAGHAVIMYPQANFEQFPFIFLYVRAICHNVVIIVLFCQDLPTSETPSLIEAAEIQRPSWELYERGCLKRP